MYDIQGSKSSQPYWIEIIIHKPNWNLCMEGCLAIIKNLRDKRVTLMKINPEIYRA